MENNNIKYVIKHEGNLVAMENNDIKYVIKHEGNLVWWKTIISNMLLNMKAILCDGKQ